MIKINTISNDDNWKKYLKNPNTFIQNKINKFNKKFKRYKKNKLFCTLVLTGNNEIRKLNKNFRKKDKTTDVLSFPFYTKKEFKKKIKINREIYLGDIIVNLNKIKNKENKNHFKIEFNKLWIHGLTHLFGYDHKKDIDFLKMTKMEKKFISYLN
jgi:probable rRNA maturation factor